MKLFSKFTIYLVVIGFVFSLGLVKTSAGEVKGIERSDQWLKISPEEFAEIVKFIMSVEQNGNVGSFWLDDEDGDTILSLAATYLNEKEGNAEEIQKEWRYKLLYNNLDEILEDFVSYYEDIPLVVLHLDIKGSIFLKKPEGKKLIMSNYISIKTTEATPEGEIVLSYVILQVNLYE